MSGPVNVGSSGEWSRLLSDNTVVVADFYADWCGPCKMIAPHFERLAKEHSKPKKVAFAKVNVDAQQSISSSLGVSAMPTFKIFRGGSCVETVKGANPSALTDAVTRAVSLAGAGGAGGAGGVGGAGDVFTRPGRTLGGSGTASAARSGSWSLGFSPGRFISALVSFFGLYFVSLITLDPFKAAESSRFNIHRPEPKPAATAQGLGAARAPPKPAFRTMSDIGSS